MITLKGCAYCQGDLFDGSCLQCSRDAPMKLDEDQVDASNMDFVSIITTQSHSSYKSLMREVNDRRRRLNGN